MTVDWQAVHAALGSTLWFLVGVFAPFAVVILVEHMGGGGRGD